MNRSALGPKSCSRAHRERENKEEEEEEEEKEKRNRKGKTLENHYATKNKSEIICFEFFFWFEVVSSNKNVVVGNRDHVDACVLK